MNRSLLRARWAALGAAVAVSLGGGAMWMVDAAPADDGVEFVAITPCRLFATRPAPSTVGARSLPLGAQETFTAAVWGTNGNCTIPTTATSVVMNVTVLAGSATSNLTVFPADAVRPNTSNLNWRAGDGPTPNAVTVGLSAAGSVSFYNAAGTVQVIADIVGYYKIESTPAQVVTVAKSGGDFTSVAAAMASITDATVNKPYVIDVAPGVYAEAAGVELKSYVDIRGAGRNATRISCACAASVDPVAGIAGSPGAVFRATDSVIATISGLSVLNTASGVWADGIDIVNRGVSSNSSISLRDVAVWVSGGTTSAAVFVSHARLTIDNAELSGASTGAVSTTATGLYIKNTADVVVDDAELSGSNAASKSGIVIQASQLRLDDSHAFASGANSFGIVATSLVPVDTFLDLKNVFLQGTTGAMTSPSGVSTFAFGGIAAGALSGGGEYFCGGVVRYATFTLLSTTCT